MGFADFTIEDLATDYHMAVAEIFRLCQELGIPYRDQDSLLSLEDVKRIILAKPDI